MRDFAEAEGLALGKVAQPIRIALTGRTISPGVFDMMDILGPEETFARLGDCARLAPTACLSGPGPPRASDVPDTRVATAPAEAEQKGIEA